MSDPVTTKPAQDPAPAGDGPGWAGQLGSVVGTVQKSPYAAVLAVGLLIVVAAFVRKVGSFELVAQGSQVLTVVVGLVLCLVGLGGPLVEARRSHRKLMGLQSGLGYHGPGQDLPAEAMDAEFLFKAFYLGMPPAFVKRVHPGADGGREASDIIFSRQLDRFQDSDETAPVGSDRRALIKADHRSGDDAALEHGRSRQVELPDSYVDGDLFPILTCKTRFEHAGAVYIAGWYVPIELPKVPEDGELVVKEEVRQMLFRPVPAARGAHVPVGAALSELGK
ncbi:hypothetical protein [Petropleomorpha daqingensis]|uniref:Uncharacterized protein n=1 Tax=Petropleomorpha daqingensis TaxID=2026353 RepID=A0A853CJ54_9ACTN|nr:hypothetical protein [Petropleomorpha daqingensis]NYJ06582.1 hypothetical protein [Petropleomorpha daqingensis]